MRRASKGIGTAILLVGLMALAYGAIAFWLIKSLPPNGGANGRLPSLYIMGVGVVVAVIGLIVRDLRSNSKKNEPAGEASKGIPTRYGLLLLLGIVVMFFVVVSQL
ncbi:MAG: hypothetical protein C0478_14575 [Planctomyces sp.]|nr:hypothetical protein [Planctomyces sp.]